MSSERRVGSLDHRDERNPGLDAPSHHHLHVPSRLLLGAILVPVADGQGQPGAHRLGETHQLIVGLALARIGGPGDLQAVHHRGTDPVGLGAEGPGDPVALARVPDGGHEGGQRSVQGVGRTHLLEGLLSATLGLHHRELADDGPQLGPGRVHRGRDVPPGLQGRRPAARPRMERLLLGAPPVSGPIVELRLQVDPARHSGRQASTEALLKAQGQLALVPGPELLVGAVLQPRLAVAQEELGLPRGDHRRDLVLVHQGVTRSEGGESTEDGTQRPDEELLLGELTLGAELATELPGDVGREVRVEGPDAVPEGHVPGQAKHHRGVGGGLGPVPAEAGGVARGHGVLEENVGVVHRGVGVGEGVSRAELVETVEVVEEEGAQLGVPEDAVVLPRNLPVDAPQAALAELDGGAVGQAVPEVGEGIGPGAHLDPAQGRRGPEGLAPEGGGVEQRGPLGELGALDAPDDHGRSRRVEGHAEGTAEGVREGAIGGPQDLVRAHEAHGLEAGGLRLHGRLLDRGLRGAHVLLHLSSRSETSGPSVASALPSPLPSGSQHNGQKVSTTLHADPKGSTVKWPVPCSGVSKDAM